MPGKKTHTNVDAFNCTNEITRKCAWKKQHIMCQYANIVIMGDYRKEAILGNTKIPFWQTIKINGVICVYFTTNWNAKFYGK